MDREKYATKIRNKNRHAFLLTFFSREPKYQTIEMNGFHLAKFFNAGKDEWEVAIYTQEAWERSQAYLQSKQTSFLGKPDPNGPTDL